MNDLIEALARARNIEQEYKDEIAELEQEIAETKIAKRLAYVKSDLLPTAKADVEDATAAVRRAGVETFEETGEYYDDGYALAYAREHLPQALKLDRRVFEKVAKAAHPYFVNITKEPRATIARDLSE
jgi:hypothetical protein